MRNTGIYRCPDDITNFKFRIRLKEITIKDNNEAENYEIANFVWQEKKFGKTEIEFYSNSNNCISDLHKKYHDEVANLTGNDAKIIYSYVQEDNYDLSEENPVTSKRDANKLSSLKLNQEDAISSATNPFIHSQELEKMSIVADFGDYYENTWIKREFLLCVLKYCKQKKILFVTPDFNKINPYFIQIFEDEMRNFEYFIEDVSDNISPELLLKENDILNKVKLHTLKLKSLKIEDDFTQVPKQKLNVFLFGEILCGKHFENSNVYVQYFLDLPENWSVLDETNLHGFTQSCVKKHEEVFFGFPFEVSLQSNIQNLTKNVIPANPCIYFEVVSKESWNRFRTEGIAYIILPIFHPGVYEFKMNCIRIRPRNLYGNLKRHFIGDYMSYNDISWFGHPMNHQSEILNKFGVHTLNSGELTVRINIIHHSQALIKDPKDPDVLLHREKFILEKLNSSGLIKSVEQVLRGFREARKKMIEVRRKT